MPSSPPQPRRRINTAGGSAPPAAGRRRRRQQEPNNPRRQQAANDATSATHQAQSITTSLLRTKNIMAQELDRVSTLNTTINDDGALLHDAKKEHTGMGGTMSLARGVMKRLGRQDVRDAIILRCSIIFYWGVVGYVLWSRIKVPFLP